MGKDQGFKIGRAATSLQSIETPTFDWINCACKLDKSSA